jgi:hypothetical protein
MDDSMTGLDIIKSFGLKSYGNLLLCVFEGYTTCPLLSTSQIA